MVEGFSHRSEFTLAQGGDITQGNSLTTGLDWGFKQLTRLCSLGVVIILGWIAWVVFADARPAIAKFGWEFVINQEWDSGEQVFGGLPYILGSVVSSLIGLVFALPLGLAVAIMTSENLLPSVVRVPIAFLVELIASIPSVIVGLWGIFVFIPVLMPFQVALFEYFGWLPIFGTEPFGPSMLVAGLVLAVMIIPTIASISRDILLSVPPSLRSASMALGATRWETICLIILPSASSGIIGATILALGRALGETMAVTMVIGNSNIISASLLAPGYTIPSVLANQFAEAVDELHIGALMYLALILFVITLGINSLAVLMVETIRRQGESN
ncbi:MULTISPECIES: phosphate ABC transporter permease subunit PstC [unclassified Synechocystis]|uniref:phosphate ABC transporter permease subunit PstC n=1 Tax=unclassified Synechocystis TaxID=2640012 RepID=UPI000416EF89|nr:MULTISPECIES: phosphate ABC transporter permease subunit PstC [unclassified Synechocystis]AIE72678.1 Phosphate transport system permease protein PstC [Synechocystis sp. PCC 6714]MCT0254664.1 phosphate ABC transporter permease subunit PstC [Synechocystis sp. CS-94]